MFSLLESPIASQASPAGGGVTSGDVARMASDAALQQSGVSAIQGGRRRQRRSSKRRSVKGRKSRSSRRRRSLRRPLFLL